MGIEENKSIVRRYVEELWNGDFSLLDALVHEDLVDHMTLSGQHQGRAGHEYILRMVAGAFPERTVTLRALVAEGDKVVDFWTFDAVHAGDFMGIPATGKRVRFRGIDITRIEEGRIREIWHVEELLSIMEQIGAVSLPVSAPASA